MLRTITWLLAMLLLLIALSACGGLQKQTATTSPKPAITKTPPISTEKQPVKTPVSAPSQTGTVQRTLQALLQQEDYASALELIREIRGNGFAENTIAMEYLLSFSGALEQSDQLQDSKDYAQAGQLLRTVLETYPEDPEIARQTGVSKKYVSDRLSDCAEELMEIGLTAYRAEDFKSALETWQQVLSFAPEHIATRKAIRTTELQLANLNSLDKKQPAPVN